MVSFWWAFEGSSLWTYFSRYFWIYSFILAYGEINTIYKYVLGIFLVMFPFLAGKNHLWFHQFAFKKSYVVIITALSFPNLPSGSWTQIFEQVLHWLCKFLRAFVIIKFFPIYLCSPTSVSGWILSISVFPFSDNIERDFEVYLC